MLDESRCLAQEGGVRRPKRRRSWEENGPRSSSPEKHAGPTIVVVEDHNEALPVIHRVRVQ